MATQYARNDQVRVHVYMSGVGTSDPDPLYVPNMGVAGLSQDLGDITNVEVPDPDRYGEFKVVDGIPGQRGRATTTLTTRRKVGMPSALETIAKRQLVCDFHLNRGICAAPQDPASFSEKLILEGVRATNYSTSELSALSSDERSSTTDSADISIDNWYVIYQMLYGLAAAPSENAGVPMGIVIAPTWCAEGALQCGVVFVASEDNLHFVTGAGAVATNYAGGDISGIGALGARIAVGRAGTGIDLVQYDGNGVTYTTTKAISGLNTIESFYCNGRDGVLGSALTAVTFNSSVTTVNEADLTALAGAGATELSDVHVDMASEMYVAISDKGYVAYSEDGVSWMDGGNITLGALQTGTAVAAVSKECWLAGSSEGKLFLSSDRGATWTEVLDTTGAVNDILVASKHVIYAAIGSTLWRSTDGGASWNAEPNVQGRSFVSVTSVNRLAICPDDINEVRMAGVAGGNLRMITGTPG